MDHLETLLIRQCSGLDGSILSIQVGKRNGQAAPIFHPDWTRMDLPVDDRSNDERIEAIRRELSVNLNPVERRTWEQLINDRSIAEIARDEGRTRSAIYERIRGNSKGQGGMIAKNPYVALWWCERLRSLQSGEA
jgi:hypothetical protein